MLGSLKYFLGIACVGTASIVFADTSVPMYATAVSGVGKYIGTINISETSYGLLFTPHLKELSPGIHGFHIHIHPSCEQNGMAAGGHFDPKNTNKHRGPYNDNGHLGDLPALTISSDGTATLPILAPRLHQIAEIKNHALMLHEGGDNYSDSPKPLGGGAGRMNCGVIG
jgi:superoxide dismutase, Cu-Zn family